ncbi:phosphate-starvation-inducible PsiE family protein [Kovacikia minuta CCNUW1]|uniref:phosphate-starvation-inducible PsiE family protein n=1 Tax=Kovacikia minuta TaxID=2931930 RepID=UPI001CCCAD66|nr:phosphate-starvation-inducible PsiE family protein [Kovacikia minuta]UBF26237.1 phosphate-starvation-inducible PsiE family protein [Kovacikia minuta CCNUW1]
MKSRQKLAQQLGKTLSDESFLRFLGGVESLVSKVLSIAMVVVILVAVYDLGFFLVKELFTVPLGRFSTTLLTIFGLFLNVLIALEILENITAYLKKHVIQVELVIVTSLIAVSRKIIILDLEKTSGIDLIALAVTIFALSISYWIIKRVNRRSQSP